MPVDFIVGAAVGVAAASPRVRKAVRQGLVYGIGGVLVAFDKVAAVAKDARQRVAPTDAATPEETHANGSCQGETATAPDGASVTIRPGA
jgi:hypothetical protein